MSDLAPHKGDIISRVTLDRIKHLMVTDGLLSEEHLKIAEKKANDEKVPLSSTLQALGFVGKEKLVNFIGDKIHIPYVNIKSYAIDHSVLDRVPEKIARRYNVIPLFLIEDVMTVAISNPLDIISLDEISAVAGIKVEPAIASFESIRNAIDQWYGIGDARRELVEELASEIREAEQDRQVKLTGVAEIRLQKEASEPPIVKLVNGFIAQAILENASDIHLEPKKDSMLVRFRIDGFLYERHKLPAKLTPPIVSRIKIMSVMDISRKRIPQDGRMSLNIRNKNVDIRTSSFPSMYGENVVLRILDKEKGVLPLSDLGMSRENFKTMEKMINAKKGIMLATGPTGSGKTTTIYSAISALRKDDKNIMTVEDPIEFEIEGLIQGQIDPAVGVTFAGALRSILRQDPDIIYVGEIRDFETAEISIRSALTGHLVLSTLHTNDAVGAVSRLRDIGVESSLISSVLNCSFAQRLIRKICPKCKKPYGPDKDLLNELGLPLDTKFYEWEGCDYCNGIGYRGRIGIFEIMAVNKEIRKLIEKKTSDDEILETARSQGMKTLFEDGLQKVIDGVTTFEEIERVTDR